MFQRIFLKNVVVRFLGDSVLDGFTKIIYYKI